MRNIFTGIIAGSLITTLSWSQSLPVDSILRPFQWRNIGPANSGGRVVDIEALDSDYRKVWLATGSGGVWYSENAGNTWTPIFDRYETASIGDIAVFQPNPKIIWVGTGENNNRNSVSWGNGVYKSVDGGKTFRNMGLQTSHHIGRVVVHPTDPNIAYVAAMGHLWGEGGERGLYKTFDGGTTWERLNTGLPGNTLQGCTDLVMDPSNPDILYAAFYYRLRTGYNFQSGTKGGGIFKTTNGGKTWTQLFDGLPTGLTGRIGLAICRSQPRVLMAIIEANASDTLAVPGSGIYRSEDAGEHWTYVNKYNNRPFYYSQIRIHPGNAQIVYVLTTPFMVSDNGGKTFTNGSPDEEIHGDFHAMWIDPVLPDRFYIGADKGASLTQDAGKHFILFDNIPIAQYYRIATDMRTPYTIYGGLQDNGFYAVQSFSRDARGILNDVNWKVHWGDGQYAAVNPNNPLEVYTSSENGSILRLDPPSHKLTGIGPDVYNTSNIKRYRKPGMDPEQPFFRFNWSAPFLLSPHDNKTLYIGAQYVLRSRDGGKSWTIISPDLSSGDSTKIKTGMSGGITPDNTGAENYGTVYALALSPLDPNIIWAGTDDGRLHLSTNDGRNWKLVSGGWPADMRGLWIDRVVASAHRPKRAYVSVDGHRSDVFKPFLMVTEDAGKTWTSITANIPGDEVIRSFAEDPVNENLLFAGTETGIWFSLSRGREWYRLNKNLPTVSVYDLKIHPRDKDLIAATHGRSLWIMDDISPLEQLASPAPENGAVLFDQRPVILWENTSRGGQRGHFLFAGENPPGIRNTSSVPRAATAQSALITIFLGAKVAGPVRLVITDTARHLAATIDTTLVAGIHRLEWDMVFDDTMLLKYEVAMIDSLVQAIPGVERAVETAARRLRQAKTAQAQREQVARIVERVPGIPIPGAWLPSTAVPGAYQVILTAGNEQQKKPLLIAPDPLSPN